MLLELSFKFFCIALMTINGPNAKNIREMTESNEVSDLSCPRVAQSDNLKTATVVCIWE